jgi:4-hydroxythreonine-4-phosphate dehydrogenase
MNKKKSGRIKIGISVGDLNGIGLEVILKTLNDSRICELCNPIVYGSKRVCNYYIKALNLNNLSLNYFDSIEAVKGKKPNAINVWEEEVNIELGQETELSGKYSFLSLEAASKDLKEGKIDALVTAPINKKAIQAAGFQFPGHTEYLQDLDEAEDSLMLMLSEISRIGVVSGHIPLKDVPKVVTTDLILRKLNLFNKSLKEDFAIRKPKIALLGLNPHAGENGTMGKEEEEIIIPAIKQAKSIDILAFGPYPADGLFASGQYRNFDGILAMYHDQGLIPAKLFATGQGVNFTAGLSFVRTSPDHGTAFDIAGQDLAKESSFRSALYHAINIVKLRRMKEELEENPLVVNKSRN